MRFCSVEKKDRMRKVCRGEIYKFSEEGEGRWDKNVKNGMLTFQSCLASQIRPISSSPICRRYSPMLAARAQRAQNGGTGDGEGADGGADGGGEAPSDSYGGVWVRWRRNA